MEAPRLRPPTEGQGCDFCRISGTVVFSGVSGYLAHSAWKHNPTRGGKAVTLALSALFAGMAVVRWRTP
jgi:hypothetical protein